MQEGEGQEKICEAGGKEREFLKSEVRDVQIPFGGGV